MLWWSQLASVSQTRTSTLHVCPLHLRHQSSLVWNSCIRNIWAFKFEIEEKDLFGWQNCHLHTTTLFTAIVSLHVRYVIGIPESEKKNCLWNAKSWDLKSVILLEESGILLMIGICTLTAMVMVFRSRWFNFRPYRLKIWPRLWRSNFWPVLLTDLLNAWIFNRSKVCPRFVRCHTNEVCI